MFKEGPCQPEAKRGRVSREHPALVYVKSLVDAPVNEDDGRLEGLFTSVKNLLDSDRCDLEQVIEVLMRGVSPSSDYRVLSVALRLLGHTDCKLVFVSLFPLLNHEEPLVRYSALYFARMSSLSLSSLPLSLWDSLVFDSSVYVQREAHMALASSGDTNVAHHFVHGDGSSVLSSRLSSWCSLLSCLGSCVDPLDICKCLVQRALLVPSLVSSPTLSALRSLWKLISSPPSHLLYQWIHQLKSRPDDAASFFLSISPSLPPETSLLFWSQCSPIGVRCLVEALSLRPACIFSRAMCMSVLLTCNDDRTISRCLTSLRTLNCIPSPTLLSSIITSCRSNNALPLFPSSSRVAISIPSPWFTHPRLFSSLSSMCSPQHPSLPLVVRCAALHHLPISLPLANSLLSCLQTPHCPEDVCCDAWDNWLCSAPPLPQVQHVASLHLLRSPSLQSCVIVCCSHWPTSSILPFLLAPLLSSITSALTLTPDDWPHALSAVRFLRLNPHIHPDTPALLIAAANFWAAPVRAEGRAALQMPPEHDDDHALDTGVQQQWIAGGPDRPSECCD